MNTIFWLIIVAGYLGVLSIIDHDILFITVPLILLAASAWLRAGVPPFVLMLGATGSASFILSRRIMAIISPLTIVELLNYDAVDESVKGRMQYEIDRNAGSSVSIMDFFFPSARIVSDDELWKTAVAQYCFAAKVIVFDFRERSTYTEFEIQTINDNDLWYKVMILGWGGRDNWLLHQPWFKTNNIVDNVNFIPEWDDGLITTEFLQQIISEKIPINPNSPVSEIVIHR